MTGQDYFLHKNSSTIVITVAKWFYSVKFKIIMQKFKVYSSFNLIKFSTLA